MTMNEYLEKHPWTKGYDPYPETPEDELMCSLMWLPEGWVKAFGEQMCEELNVALRKTGRYDEAYVIEAKEKYGELRVSIYPSNEEIENILLKYEEISTHVCMHCGAVDVPMLNLGGWLSVYCRECFDQINADGRYKPYDEVIDGEAQMPDFVKWTRYSTNGTEHFELDISETAEKIRERWRNRVADADFERSDESEDK